MNPSQVMPRCIKAGTYLFGVLKVFKKSVLIPSDALVHVGSGVGETFSLTGLTTEDTESCHVNIR